MGYIHSIESFGTVDGPGIRLVVFMQGCPLRCKYCHNPDTWAVSGGRDVLAEDILTQYEKKKAFLKNGGITVSGGEPLLQIEFVTDLFKKAKKKNIHTCLDTSGYTFNKNKSEQFDKLMQYTDLVLLDLKHIDNQKHLELTGVSNKPILEFAKYLQKIQKPTWVRHVVIEGITFNEKYLNDLGYFIGGLDNVKTIDVLPYHTLGEFKYKELGIPYPLNGVPEATKETVIQAKEIILEGFKRRTNKK